MSGPPDAAPLRVGLSEHRAGDFTLESGETLRDVRQAFRLEGEIDADGGNVVLLFHSLTGSPADLGGWRPFVGPGLPIDTSRYAVLAPNLLGSCYGTRFLRGARHAKGPPSVTTRDQARLAALLLDALGVRRLALVAGGSLGGMVALELCATRPDAARAAIVFAAPASPTAWGSAWNHVHRTALEAAPRSGLALARMVGMLTYRTPLEVERRFRPRAPGTHPVRDYLNHHGEKLVRRFTTKAYLTLLDAIDAHDVARGRGSVRRALGAFRGRLLGGGIPGDRRRPPEEVLRWTRAAGAEFRELASRCGHDGFLLETEAVGALLAGALSVGGAGRSPALAPLLAANLDAGPPP
ncbi:MAG TPA: alpha/beta fold hydrolase [Thermoanaerobaculia bacterium]|nr:alpha/beta fold hydrolase [Thermoanaerobaculia bacterium]